MQLLYLVKESIFSAIFFYNISSAAVSPSSNVDFQANDIINTRIHASVTLQFYLKNGFNKNEYFFQFCLWRYSVKTHGVST
jgi:hypothetical protein